MEAWLMAQKDARAAKIFLNDVACWTCYFGVQRGAETRDLLGPWISGHNSF
jgi:hypothetical protein